MAFKDRAAETAYKNEFNKMAYDRIGLFLPKGDKEQIKDAADQAGESVNRYIIDAVRQRMENERKP